MFVACVSGYSICTSVVDGLRHGDLTHQLDLDHTSDKSMNQSIRVLPAEIDLSAVDTISEIAPIAIFSIARLGQSGDYHLNEQTIGHWIGKFEILGVYTTNLMKSSSEGA